MDPKGFSHLGRYHGSHAKARALSPRGGLKWPAVLRGELIGMAARVLIPTGTALSTLAGDRAWGQGLRAGAAGSAQGLIHRPNLTLLSELGSTWGLEAERQ